MSTMPRKQIAVRLTLPMAAAAQECAWMIDRRRGTAESSGYIQRWLEEVIERELRSWGYWPPSAKTWAGEAPKSPHTGRPTDASREARTEERINRTLDIECALNNGLTDREYFEKHGRWPPRLENKELPPARTREEADELPDTPPLQELPADEARGDELASDPLTDEDGNIL